MMTLNAIDPRAGSHFTGKIFVTPHACDRAVEYFGVERKAAPMHVMDLLRQSALIDSDVLGDDGSVARLFAHKRYAFVVDREADTVITLYPRNNAAEEIRSSVARVLERTLRAARRKEAIELKRLNIRKAELAVERAECELRLLKTASSRVIDSVRGRLTRIDEQLTKIDVEITEARREKAAVAKGVCAYVV